MSSAIGAVDAVAAVAVMLVAAEESPAVLECVAVGVAASGFEAPLVGFKMSRVEVLEAEESASVSKVGFNSAAPLLVGGGRIVVWDCGSVEVRKVEAIDGAIASSCPWLSLRIFAGRWSAPMLDMNIHLFPSKVNRQRME